MPTVLGDCVCDWDAACELVPETVADCVWLTLAPWLLVAEVVGVAPWLGVMLADGVEVLDRVGAWDEDAVRVGVLDTVGICVLLAVRLRLPVAVSDGLRLWLKVDACERVGLPDGLPVCEAVTVPDADAACDPDMVWLCVVVCDAVLI